MRADGEPYYSNVTKFVGIDVGLAAKIKGSYTGDLPYGTLTSMSSGIRYMLTPNETFGNFCGYDVQGVESLASLAGQKVMWNVYTSPDVIVGAAVIPEDVSAYSVDISNGAIIPYVKINHDSYNASYIGRVDLYFVRSGDSTPVALGDTTVKVYVNDNSLNGSYPYYQFTNFNKAVRNSFTLNTYEEDFKSMTVEYEKDGAKYIWNFVPAYGTYSSIEWGKLALENQPLTLKTGESVDIEIKIPARHDLSEYFTDESSYGESYFLGVGSSDVLGWQEGSLSFDQGSAGWDGLTYNEEKSTLSFTLVAGTPGRTALRVQIPNEGQYYREVHVTDENGDLVLSGDVPEAVSLQVSEYRTHARFVNGRPWYPSAENESMNYSLVISSDNAPGYGYFGMTNGTTSEVHEMWRTWNSTTQTNSYYIDYGAYYDTDDSSVNTEYHTLSITEDEIENANVWMEFPNDSSFNVVSASLKSLIVSSDYMTTAEQLENFAPYFQMKHDPDDVSNVVSLDWCFVNPKTMEKVTPDVSNVRINYENVEGTSGTISDPNSWNVDFQYDCNGVTYIWDFYEMDYNSYGEIPLYSLKPGESTDVSVSLTNHTDLDAVDVSIWDTDILSADPVSFAPAETISFDVLGLKEGTTRIALVFTQTGYDSSYNRYVQGYTDVTVSSSGSSSTVESLDLTPSFHAEIGSGAIIEGLPTNYSTYDTPSRYVKLSHEGTITSEYYYNYISSVNVIMHFYSGDVEMYSNDITPYVTSWEYDDDDGTEYVTLSGGEYYIDNSITHVEWTESSNIIISGSADVPAFTSPASFDFKPYVKLNREGLNISTLEYYFVDSNDNTIATPEGVSNISVNVSTHYGSDFSNEDESGTITLNIPETFLNTIDFYFTYDGLTYRASFSPVNHSYWNLESSDVISWDVENPELPLIMYVGESIDVSLTAPNIDAPVPYVGNSGIVAMDILSSSDHTVNVHLTAKAAGMTSIILISTEDRFSVTYPREIWVADTDGKLPHLTGDGTIDDIIGLLTSDDLTSGTSGGWNESTSSSTTSSDVDSGLETTDPVEVLAGLSVNPRYALPTDPSGDVYSQTWDKIYDENLSYGAYMFEDDVEVVASRDVMEVFNELSADLISRYPAQILAVVLPEIDVQANGVYTFRIPVDNITPKGTKIFMHANALDSSENDSSTPSIYTPNGIVLSGDVYTLTSDYSVLVSIDAATWQVKTSDVYLPDGFALSVEKADANGDISLLRIYAEDNCFEAYEASERKNVSIEIYNRTGNYYTGFGWSFAENSTSMNYYTDEGTELEYISGDEYVNVAVYLDSGTYAPVITAKATNTDVALITEIIRKNSTPPAPAALTLTASTVSMSIAPNATGTVTLTPRNAVGTVTYTANQTWVTFSGNVATLAPTAPGTYSVVITARDTGGRTATVTIRVTATAASPASGDVRPPESGDVRPPESGDVNPPAPVDSGDVNPPTPPASGDVNPPAPVDSGDQPAPTPPASGDVTPGGDNTNPGGGDTPGGDNTNPGGDTTPSDEVVPVPATVETPTVNINNESVVQTILNALSSIVSFITGNTEIAELPENGVGSARSIDDVSEEELAQIPEGETPAAILPIMRVERPAVYVFNVVLSNLNVGAPIRMYMMAQPDTVAAEFTAADDTDTEDVYTFLNDDGEEITTVPANKSVNVAAYMEPGYTYAPLITTTASSNSGDDNSGDNSGGNSGTDTPTTNRVGGSGGGCDAGFSFMALALFGGLGLLAKLTKKRLVK